MMNPSPGRRRFLAAMALYLAWVGILAGMAVTSARRPPTRLIPPAADEATPSQPANP